MVRRSSRIHERPLMPTRQTPTGSRPAGAYVQVRRLSFPASHQTTPAATASTPAAPRGRNPPSSGCKEITFAPAAPGTVRTGPSSGREGVWRVLRASSTASPRASCFHERFKRAAHFFRVAVEQAIHIARSVRLCGEAHVTHRWGNLARC